MTRTLEANIHEKHAPYSKAHAKREAERCLHCYDPPCVKACPTEIDIPNFINKIANDNVAGAAKTILQANILGRSCAKVCPVEVLCAGACVYNDLHEPPIEIGRLQDYATSWAIKNFSVEQVLGAKKSPNNKRIALIGAGPASLAASALLAHAGFLPTIFEKNERAGGLNAYGIAPYKLKHDEAQEEIEWLKKLGVAFRLGVEVGLEDDGADSISFAKLAQDYDGIFVGVGLGQDKMLPIEGINGPGVLSACDIIARIKTDPSFSLADIARAHVIGGGNTAMDVAHELKLLGVPHVSVLYRRGRADMSAYAHEVYGVQTAGVFVEEHVNLKTIVRDGAKLIGFTTSRSDDLVRSDLIVLAIGQQAAQEHVAFPALAFDDQGRVKVDPKTHRVVGTKIWAAGDCVNGGKEVVNAVAEAKIAVANMISTLM